MNLFFENEKGEIIPFENVVGIAFETITENDAFATHQSESGTFLMVYADLGDSYLRIALNPELDKKQLENYKKWINMAE